MIDKTIKDISNEDMLLLKQLKDILSDGILEDLLELKKTIEGKSLESSHIDSFEYWYKSMGSACFRLPHLRRFFVEDYGKKTAELINVIYKKWSSKHEQ